MWTWTFIISSSSTSTTQSPMVWSHWRIRSGSRSLSREQMNSVQYVKLISPSSNSEKSALSRSSAFGMASGSCTGMASPRRAASAASRMNT